MRWVLAFVACLLLTAQTCKPVPPPPGPPPPGTNPYCYGTPGEPSLIDKAIGAIYGGSPADDRRATLRMVMGGGYCTGVAYGPHVALTSGHCTYGASQVTASTAGYGVPPYFEYTDKAENPDYFAHRSSGNQGFGRAADVSVVQFGADRTGEVDELPGPYVNKVFDPLNQEHASHCLRLWAMGWGRGDHSGLQLMECEYEIDEVTDQYVRTNHEDAEACRQGCATQYQQCGSAPGCFDEYEECQRICDVEACRICFGDSGGPLYAEMDNGELWLVGLTMWTGSQECDRYSTHARLSAPGTARVPEGMETWVHNTARIFSGE